MPYRTPPASVEITRDQLSAVARALVVKSAAGDHVTVKAKWKSSFFTLTTFYIAMAIVTLGLSASCERMPAPLIALSLFFAVVAVIYHGKARPIRTITFFADVRVAMTVSGPLAQTRPIAGDDISVRGGWRPQISIDLGGWPIVLVRRSGSANAVASAADVLRQIVGAHRIQDDEVVLNGIPSVSRLPSSIIKTLASKLPHHDVAVEAEQIAFWASAPFLSRFLSLMFCVFGIVAWWLAAFAYDIHRGALVTVVAGTVALVLLVPGVILSFRGDPWLGKNLIVIPRGRSEVLLLEGASGNWRETGDATDVRRFPVEESSFRFVEYEGTGGVTISSRGWTQQVASGADSEECGRVLAQYAVVGHIDGA